MTYNERFTLNNESISNKEFTEIANEVINKTESININPNTYEILTIMSLLYFKKNNVDVALLEVSEGGLYNATNICSPKISAITRANPDNSNDIKKTITEMLGIVKKETKAYYLNIMKEKENIKGLILGCTELPLILNQEDIKDIKSIILRESILRVYWIIIIDKF